jgi:aldehyde dehydrogenase (NAD+)
VDSIKSVFELQQSYRWIQSNTTAIQRKDKLRSLLNWIYSNRQNVREALYADFKKPAAETDLTELYTSITEVKFAIRNIHKWLRPQRVKRTLPMLTTRASIRYEARGVVLIMAPWNFPFLLNIGPLVSAIAAGNCVCIKPSEYAPHTSELVAQAVRDIFKPEEAHVFEGGLDVAQSLLKLPFDHIFFTGSMQVGQKVMRAAAEHHSTVTLELGGKSPAIIDATADIRDAAQKIAWGKFANGGQACISPDFLMVEHSIKQKFIEQLAAYITKFYKRETLSCIVSESHFDRLEGFLEDSVNHGAEIIYGGGRSREQACIDATIVDHPWKRSKLMEEEIFGPILPILTFKELPEVPEFLKTLPKPLALYIFSKQKKNINYLFANTSAGGSCVNDVMIHFLHANLPFGGVNHSGFGSAHGFYGFKSFAHERAILRSTKYSILKLLLPPYTEMKKNLIDLTLKYF